MSRTTTLTAFAFATFVLLMAPSCGGGCCGPDGGGDPPGDQAPEFLLEDMNTTSASYQQLLSPRAYVGHVSAWYFGQAT